jgi:hypothetical protein
VSFLGNRASRFLLYSLKKERRKTAVFAKGVPTLPKGGTGSFAAGRSLRNSRPFSKVHLCRCEVLKGLMRSLLIVIGQIFRDALTSFSRRAIVLQVNILIFDGSPQVG